MLGVGLSLSPANRGRAALEEEFSSVEEEAELCERCGTCRLSSCWLCCLSPVTSGAGEHESRITPTLLAAAQQPTRTES